MRTHVEFRSDAFPAQAGEDEQINPGRWGKALADYLRAQLDEAGLVGGAPIAEDWGWLVPIVNDDFPLWVGCGNYEEYPDGFLCFIQPSKPKIRKLFRSIDTTERLAKVADAIDAALRTHWHVRELRWWSDDEARS
jgi:hypothetical protein